MALHFDPWASEKESTPVSVPEVIYGNDIPLTASGVLMLLILMQLGSYYFYARRFKATN